MSGLDKDRKRNQTIAFRMTPEERQELEARIKVTGKPKGIYFIECCPNRIAVLIQRLNNLYLTP